MGCPPHQFFLGKLTLQGIFYRCRWVCCTSHPHGLVYISPPGKGVADSAAQAGCRTAERLNFRGVVMGFIFEIYQPFFCLPIHFYRDYNRAGIDLLRFLLVFQLPFFFQPLHSHQGKVHQADKLVLTALVQFFMGIQVVLIRVFHGFLVKPFPKGHFL